MTEKDYKYIENRLNELCKPVIKIVYDKSNVISYYKYNEIAFDKITLKVYGYGSHKLSISKRYASYKNVIDLLHNKILEVTNK